MKGNKSPDSEGFITVSYKGKKNRNRRKPTTLEILAQLQQVGAESAIFDKTKLESAVEDLKCSDFFMKFKENLNCVLKIFNKDLKLDSHTNFLHAENLSENDNVIDIVCYGLGNFTSCVIARYQLAFLIILKDIISPRNISIYDPVFVSEEKRILQEFGCNVLDINEEGKRSVLNRTIFYMPHCCLFLYNNLLWANWCKDKLSKIILIGNSFEQYMLHRTARYLKEKASYVNFASEFVNEITIINEFKLPDIFNNLSFHCFHNNTLSKVPFHVWNYKVEPVNDGDEELIKNSN